MKKTFLLALAAVALFSCAPKQEEAQVSQMNLRMAMQSLINSLYLKANVTDNPNGATYDQTNSYSDDEAKADGLGLDGSINTNLEDPFDSKETDLFSGVNFSELFW